MKDNKPYIHDKNIKYPDCDFVHMINLPKVHDYVYDKSFPYRQIDRKSRFVLFLYRLGIFFLVKPLCYIRYGLRIKGKRNIKQYRKLIGRKAMISVCNHTTEWDILFVMTSRYFHFAEFPMWQEGAESKSGALYRGVGGIVLPTKSYQGMNYAYEALRDVIKEEKWLHVFPEAACWAFYPAIRPFRSGAFQLAYEENMPILPMVVKYRRPGFLYRIFKKHPNATLLIGEPMFANYDLDKNESVIDFTHRVRVAMMNLLGLNEEENQELINSLPTYHVDSKSFSFRKYEKN